MKYCLLTLMMSLLWSCGVMANKTSENTTVRIATFNVSMEALNYIEHERGQKPNVKGTELLTALNNGHQQIKNIAEIIQTVNPDIILLNEFDYYNNEDSKALTLFIQEFLAKGQGKQKAVSYPYFYQSSVNTGVQTPFDLNSDKEIDSPSDTYGFGYFPGQFAMALLSKFPIDEKAIRTFQKFKWSDMPDALQPIDPETNAPWYPQQVWQQLRLSSKSHWDVPIKINGRTLHVLASHPTPPVFDGPEDRNGKRNHDEIRFWTDYITEDAADYIYDDSGVYGGLTTNSRFVILGDQNASVSDGDANNAGIGSLLTHSKITDPLPKSLAGQLHSQENPNAKYHTAYWRMRADYVLPSSLGMTIVSSGVFWPEKESDKFHLVANRQASSDHRLVWVDVKITD